MSSIAHLTVEEYLADIQYPVSDDALREKIDTLKGLKPNLSLIHDDDFNHHVMDAIYDCISPDGDWLFNCIDLEAAIEALKDEYTEIELDGELYFYKTPN